MKKLLPLLLLISLSGIAQNPGQIDATFTATFPVSPTSVEGVIELPNKQLLVSADDPSTIGLFKLNSNGTADMSFNFGTYGICKMNYRNGKIAVTNADSVFILKEDGTKLFSKKYNPVPTNTMWYSDTTLLLIGSNDKVFLIDTLGNLFSSFAVHQSPSVVRDVLIQPDGKLLVASLTGLIRLDSVGVVDTSFHFNISNFTQWDVNDIALQSNDKIIFGGDCKYTGSIFNTYVGRLNADGTKDATFSSSINNQVRAVAVQSDNKILCAGYFTAPSNRIARLNINGATDATFNVGTGADATTKCVSLQDDGKVLVGGYLANMNGTACDQLVRLYGDKSARAKICLVTVDTATGKNQITWEREYGLKINRYKIYKESTSSSYVILDSLPFGATQMMYIDTLSNPQVKSDRYAITALDSNGIESPIKLNEVHKTIHLTISLGITTGSYNLNWDAYEGLTFTTYYIYQVDSAGASLIDSVASSSTSYTHFAPAGTLSYFIAIKNANGCDTYFKTSSSYTSSVSNRKILPLSTGIESSDMTSEIKLYPNPANRQTTVYISCNQTANVKIDVYNLIGERIMDMPLNSMNAGTKIYELSLNESGVYFVMVRINDQTITNRLVITQ